jgi:hypothetical protein
MVLILPYVNGNLLGDKIVYSSIVQHLSLSNPSAQIIGVEDVGLLSMKDYAVVPHSIIEGRVHDVIERLLEEQRLEEGDCCKIILYTDQNSIIPDKWLNLSEVVSIDLWDALRQCADRLIFPKINVKSEWLSEAEALLKESGIDINESYIAAHIRLLSRQPWKNSDPKLFKELLEKVADSLSLPIILIGLQDERLEFDHPRIIDFGVCSLPVELTAGLLAKAALFIGGDSGPIHLAGAVGCPVLGIGCVTERFGPFVPQEQLVGLFGRKPEGKITQLESVEQVVNCIQNVCLSTPSI